MDEATTDFAHEAAPDDAALTNADQDYLSGIDRTPSQDFSVRWTLGLGKFDATPTVSEADLAHVATLRSGGAGSNFVEYDYDVITNDLAILDIITLNAPDVLFPAGSPVGSVMTITVDLRDLAGPIDTSGDKTVDIATLAAATSLTATTDVPTIVNVNAVPPRTEYNELAPIAVPDTSDGIFVARALLTINTTTAGVVDPGGAVDYDGATAPDSFTITITGDFTGLETDEFCYDLNDTSTGTTVGCDAGEIFTIDSGVATLTVAGDDLSAHVVVFGKVPTAVLSAPRTFGVSVDIDAAAGSTQDRTLSGGDVAWWQWGLNGAVLNSGYGSYFPGNETKYRFSNKSSDDFLCFPEVTPDQPSVVIDLTTGTADFGPSGEFNVPANSNVHVELSAPAGAGAIGPMTTLVSGTQPVRVRVVFTCLTHSNNVEGQTLIASPVGVVTIAAMP